MRKFSASCPRFPLNASGFFALAPFGISSVFPSTGVSGHRVDDLRGAKGVLLLWLSLDRDRLEAAMEGLLLPLLSSRLLIRLSMAWIILLRVVFCPFSSRSSLWRLLICSSICPSRFSSPSM